MRRRAALALATALWAAPALAASPGDFSFYVLSLSWSPSFCATARHPAAECSQRRGFVVHGLWPQDARGFPEYCSHERGPSRRQARALRDLMPDPALIVHEWRAHGTCSGLNPERFFETLRRAAARVAGPAAFADPAAPPRETSPAAVEAAFRAANPALKPDMMAVECRDGRLSEVRICLDRETLAFRPCPDVARHACRARRLSVPPAQ